MKRLPWIVSILVLFLPVLSACSPSAAQTTPTVEATLDQNRMNTAVAATMSVLSTEVASLKASAQAPTTQPTPKPTGGTPSAATAPTATSQPRSATCDFASFVGDVTIPDGTMIPGNTPFVKTWAIKNIGTCTWTPDYQIVYDGGDVLGSPLAVPMVSKNVAPGETVQISLTLTAPPDNKRHYSYWKFRNAQGGVFGVVDVATNQERPVWAEIQVGDTYSFVDNMCLATWKTGSGTLLTCPGDPTSTSGAVYRMNNSQWEGDVIEDEPVLVLAPPAGENTTIVGQFPPIIVPTYDWLLARVGCLRDLPDCSATVRITYSVDGGPEQPLYEGEQQYDNSVDPINVKLIEYSLANKSVSFLFYVTANGDGANTKIFFFLPRLDPNK